MAATQHPFLRALAQADRGAYAEQLIFARSPLNLWLTAIVIYGLMILIYAAAAASAPWIVNAGGGPILAPGPRLALTLALMVCSVLAVQRYVAIKQCAEVSDLTGVLRPQVAATTLAIPGIRLGRASLVGAAFGAVLAALNWRSPTIGLAAGLPQFFWFAAVITLLAILFARGVELSRAGGRNMAAAVDGDLVIDLLQIERQHAWGRLAALVALVWFTVSAASCLLFVRQEITPFSIVILVACAGMGVWVFVAMQLPVRRKIREAKAAELQALRAEVASVRRGMKRDAAAAHRLPGLLAYEARIAAVREWPFDQPIIIRLAASALLLAVPWFGHALAIVVVERLGGLVR